MITWPELVEWGPKLPQGAFSEYDMEAIWKALKDIPKGGIYLEVGVRNGRSLAWARAMSKGVVYGIDINDELHRDWFEGKKDWHFIHNASNDAVKNWTLPIDVLFIDGDHSYEGVKDDWQNFEPFVKKGGKIFFHDCDETSPGVVELFKEIKYPKVLCRREMDERNTSMSRADK